MSAKMKPISVIKARLGIQKNGPAHAFLTQTCFRYMTPFVPGGVKSHLNQNADLRVNKIIYEGPTAQNLYYGKLMIDPKYKVGAFPIRNGKISFKEKDGPIEGFVSRKGITKINSGKDLKYHTLGTGAHWDKLMWTSQRNKVVKEVQDYVDRGCK